jgi:peptidoglycan/xylan/chitin deacetylase (PgdA/CDA1 family)
MSLQKDVNKDPISPRIILTFDDGYDSVYEKAYPIMSANGQKGVAFVCNGWNDNPTYMTLAKQQALYNAGWDISNHTYEHNNLSTDNETDMQTHINQCTNYLKQYFPRSWKFIAYPWGLYNQNVIAYCNSQGFIFGRTILVDTYENQLNLATDNLMELKLQICRDTTTIEEMKGYVDDVIALKGLVILIFHTIVDADADNGNKVLTATFQELSNYIKTKTDAGLLKCVTMSEYYNDYLVETAGQANIRGLSHG